ncbi:MAG: cobalamin-dependent protein [Phycisphaerae bacterium]|nr:cobalamin-dependent protein [Phycisphaerae bacterium]
MKILLVSPVPPKSHWPIGSFRSYWVQTGLAFIARGLQRAGHTVKVLIREERLIKSNFNWGGEEAFLRGLLKDFSPEIVGLSVFTPGVSEAGQIAGMAKDICGDHILVVAGGPHPTAMPELTLQQCSAIDAVVVGEGEETMVALAENGPSKSVAGLVLREDGAFIHTPLRKPAEDLDRLGPPAYELFDMDFYSRANRWLIRWLKLPVTNIRTSRGCTNRCLFCAGHLVAGLGLRFHSLQYVIDQLRYVVDNFGLEAILFEDDSLGADRERLIALTDAIRKHGLHRRIRWACCLRVDQVDAELLREMKAAGCIQIEYGFESGSENSLRRLGKNATVELNQRAVRLTRQAGVRIFADIMVGLPGETEGDFKATVRFLRWARPEIISAGRLCPLPGTAIWNRLSDQQRDSLNWGGFTYIDRPGFKINLTDMPDEAFEETYRRFMKYLVRPQITWAMLRDTPPREKETRRALRKKLAGFVLRHPLRAARLPW